MRKLPQPHAGSNRRSVPESVSKLPEIRHAAAVPAFLKLLELRSQIVEEQRLDHLQDVLFGGVVRTLRAPIGWFHDRLEECTEDGWRNRRPVEPARVE